jgi:hypothetical protein
MNLTVTIPLVIMEQDFLARVEVEITARSRPAGQPSLNDPGCPPEGCEWELLDIQLRSKKTFHAAVSEEDLDLPIWLAIMIEASDELEEAIAAAESDEPRR